MLSDQAGLSEPGLEAFFSGNWPTLSRKLGLHLGRFGVPLQDRDDVLQETALRLCRAWSRLDHERPVEPFARTIALNVWRDRWRRSRDHEVLVEELPEPRMPVPDVEQTAMARLELHRVGKALRQLRTSQQELVLDAMKQELAPAEHEPVPAVLRMARMRARRSLAECVGRASATVAAIVLVARKLGECASAAAPVALAVTLVAVALAGRSVAGRAHWNLGVPTTELRSQTVKAPSKMSVRAPRIVSSDRTASPARPVAARISAARARPWSVATSWAHAEAGIEVGINGSGARLSGDGRYPVCVFGVSPAGRAGLACGRPESPDRTRKGSVVTGIR
jgi:RNA polymerase sigma factor (sigma-70 family)